jgi:hypothetical protein
VKLLKEQEHLGSADRVRALEIDSEIVHAAERRNAARDAIRIHLATSHREHSSGAAV